MTEKLRVPLTRGRVWELVTENGTRHFVDLRDPDGLTRRMRIPGPGRGDWFVTTNVVIAARPLADDEVPQPGDVAHEHPDGSEEDR